MRQIKVKRTKCKLCDKSWTESGLILCLSCLSIWNLFPQQVKDKLRKLLD